MTTNPTQATERETLKAILALLTKVDFRQACYGPDVLEAHVRAELEAIGDEPVVSVDVVSVEETAVRWAIAKKVEAECDICRNRLCVSEVTITGIEEAARAAITAYTQASGSELARLREALEEIHDDCVMCDIACHSHADKVQSKAKAALTQKGGDDE